jgi:hypothetical protein
MRHSTKQIALSVRDNDHCKRLKDPFGGGIHHLEAFLPFSEAVKLDRGNANVRPPADRKPLNAMVETVEETPQTFHIKNRGITYLCDRFSFDNSQRKLTISVPRVVEGSPDLEEFEPRFGIADGGHTFEVIKRTVEKVADYKKLDDWSEPFVRIHFVGTEGDDLDDIDKVVEALNTSLQVQQYTLDEYQNKFEELKEALRKANFDVDLIAFRENEDREWHVIEIIQRLACFLKDRWQLTQPASMYKSKTKALESYKDDATRGEFRKLFDVISDVISFPEFIQAELSRGELVQRRSLGRLKAVKPLKKPYCRPGTTYETDHRMDMAALLPMAAAFRELLTLKGDRYRWRVDPKEAFRRCAADLYQVLVTRSSKARVASHLGTDMEYWGACVPIVMRVKDQMVEELLTQQVGVPPEKQQVATRVVRPRKS